MMPTGFLFPSRTKMRWRPGAFSTDKIPCNGSSGRQDTTSCVMIASTLELQLSTAEQRAEIMTRGYDPVKWTLVVAQR